MPELPEVETMVRELRPALVGRRIVSVRLSHDNLLNGVTRNGLGRGLRHATITAVTRRAKHALVYTDRRILAVQPGMSGGLMHLAEPRSGDVAKYDVLTCILDDGSAMIYRDVRRIGTLRWLTDDEWQEYQSRLGPEPLDPALDAATLAQRLGGSRSPIKKVLMNQRYLVGVGNIYACEALFAAGIDPSRAANKVSAEEYASLHHHVRRILADAIENSGTSFRDYLNSSGESRGNFQEQLSVYGRAGEPCRNCGTPLVETHEIDNRQTVFCWRCQR